MQNRLDQAVLEGADPVWVVPHPDDIVIDEEEGWTMTGPVDVDELKPIRRRVTMRDVFLLQSVLEERLSDAPQLGETDVPAVETAGSTSQVFASLLNDNLPQRFKPTVTGFFVRDHALPAADQARTAQDNPPGLGRDWSAHAPRCDPSALE
jgi:hypothetical protein